MATDDNSVEDSESFGSLADEDLGSNHDDDDDEALQDNWVEELECALLAECDPATLRKICEGKKVPPHLRYDYWRTLLALDDTERVKLTSEYDLPNQDELRQDCELLVEDISTSTATQSLSDDEKARLRKDFESTLTTYVKARPELEYVSGNGWTDILKVIYNLKLNSSQMYQVFFRIVDRYIPKDLSPTKRRHMMQLSDNDEIYDPVKSKSAGKKPLPTGKEKISSPNQKPRFNDIQPIIRRDELEKSVQAYHLLRLLIQYHDPELCSILDSKKVTPNLYVKDWFCSLFARSCSTQLALHIWDMHFKMADPFLIFFAAIVMVVNAGDELKQKNITQQDMLNILKVMPSKLEIDDIEDLYYLVSNHYTYSTPRSMRSYSHLFFMDTFGNTYSGNDSPERDDSPTFVDAKTARLTRSIDLSQYLCLPIVPAEILTLEMGKNHTGHQSNNSSPDSSPGSPSSSAINQPLRYFLVDCRPAEQYNAGHLNKAFHLDCSLMLREPSSFATAVQALLEIQRQVVASKSNAGGKHLCFIGSGQEEEDLYVSMVVASFLQRYQKYVSIVYGGFEAIHDYVKTKTDSGDSFNKYIIDHNEQLCKVCRSGSSDNMKELDRKNQMQSSKSSTQQQQLGSLGSSLLATTTSFFKSDKATAHAALTKFATSNPQATATASMLAQSGATMFNKFTTAFVSKSNVLKDRLVETINNTAMPNSAYAAARSHVSSQDRLGPRYMGGGCLVDESGNRRTSGGTITRLDDAAASLLTVSTDPTSHQHSQLIDEEPCQEVQIDAWQRENAIMAIYKCSQIKGTNRYPGYVALNRTHLWILREIPHNKGFASIAAKRPLDMVVQITSKRKQPDCIIFRYGYASNTNRTSSGSSSPASDQKESASGDKGGTTSDVRNKQPQRNLPTIIASDNLHIPEAFEVIRLIKREIVRIMDETSRKSAESRSLVPDQPTKEADPSEEAKINHDDKDDSRESESKSVDADGGEKSLVDGGAILGEEGETRGREKTDDKDSCCSDRSTSKDANQKKAEE